METANLAEAYKGSFYTICGAGGELAEWESGITKALEAQGIGKPQSFFQTTGGDVNSFAATRGAVVNPFKNDLTIIMFPLAGLNLRKLTMFKLMQADRWFDDVVDNMVAPQDDEDELDD